MLGLMGETIDFTDYMDLSTTRKSIIREICCS